MGQVSEWYLNVWVLRREKSLNEVYLSDSVKTPEIVFHVIEEERGFDFVFVVDLSFLS